jgi:hypothetical protein
MEEKIRTNILRTGEYVVYSIWLQNQLADLIIFHTNKQILEAFLTNPDVIPESLAQARLQYLEKSFAQIKTEFEDTFGTSIPDQAKMDLHTIAFLRNAIDHARVSLTVSYITYKSNVGDATQLDFSDDKVYFDNFSAIQRLDIDFLDKLCLKLGVPHGKIR